MNSVGHTGRRLMTTTFALVAALGTLSAQAQKFSVTILENLADSISVEGVAINNGGQVAGNSVDANGVSFAVLWNGTTPTILDGDDSYNPYNAFVGGMNNLGEVVGYDTSFKYFADLWGGGVSGLCSGGESGWPWSQASAINDAGQIVGTLSGDIPPWAVIWSNSCIRNDFAGLDFPTSVVSGIDATSINNKGEVVGFAYLDSDYSTQHAVRWTPNFTDMGTLGGKNSGANQINDRGFVVGWADIPNNRSHAALWGPHTVASDLGTLGGKTSSANGINTQGDAVGSSQTPSGATHAVLWTHKHYTGVDLNNEIGAMSKQITLTEAAGTNDLCQVLANGYNNKTKVSQIYVLSLVDASNCDSVTD
jgi:probable HAF family extracellular repeat protein